MTKDAKGNVVEVGDVIQITDSNDPWFPALMIVDELKGWGVMAYTYVVTNDESPNGQAYRRPKSEAFEVVGQAWIVNSPEA